MVESAPAPGTVAGDTAGGDLVLYGRDGCHLCVEMKAVLVPVCARFGVRLVEIDVDGDANLARRYGLDVPVVVLQGREIARHRLRDEEMAGLIDGLTRYRTPRRSS